MWRSRRWMALAFGLGVALSTAALAQRVVRPADAPPPIVIPVTPPPAPEVKKAPTVKTPVEAPPQVGQGKSNEDVSTGVAKPAPAFKDDLTPEELARQAAAAKLAAPGAKCVQCEAVYHRKFESTSFNLHVRPPSLAVGEVGELVFEIADILDPPDPEYGDRRPVVGEQLLAQIEGVGPYILHPIPGTNGSYGLHFIPNSDGLRHVALARIDGRAGLSVDLQVAVGRPPQLVSKNVDIREAQPLGAKQAVEPIRATMTQLGTVWGGLWTAALTGRGDAATLAKALPGLAQETVGHVPQVHATDRANFDILARSFMQSSGDISKAAGPDLKAALTKMQSQQCDRCHAIYFYGITEDVSDWPRFEATKTEAR
jgi:hypothetical protein